MGALFRSLPFFVILLLVGALAMQGPAVYATAMGDHATGRDFFYTGLLITIAAGLVAIAAQNRRQGVASERGYLVTLLLSYLWLPAVLALPMLEAVGNTRFVNVYFDMVSALTTTGAPIFEPDRLAPAVHLWRAIVGWIGGALIWVTAVAVLAPLNLGGYEVTSEAHMPGGVTSGSGQIQAADPGTRLRRHAALLIPVYVGLTAVLATGLIIAGETPLLAAIHAMSTLSTSGITPLDGTASGTGAFGAELLIFIFFLFALSRRTFSSGFGQRWIGYIGKDREIRLAVLAVVVLPSLLFARHWIGALEVDDIANAPAALSALWGSVFTVLSFLTTTGFVSGDWAAARSWSGLPTPGILLMGLVVLGGGVATTAGGLKLLRVYALYKHGNREIHKLIHPHSVAGAGRLGRRIRREGAYIAWVFFMLFLISIAATMLALALQGLAFEEAMILAISALSTTGPLASVAGEAPISYLALSDASKITLSAAMILGRMETLVLIALFNPGFWRA